jgi:hypothetical protein
MIWVLFFKKKFHEKSVKYDYETFLSKKDFSQTNRPDFLFLKVKLWAKKVVNGDHDGILTYFY